MKLAACFNVFDGEELLAASMAQARRYADIVLVAYQTVSHFGSPHPDPGRLRDLAGSADVAFQFFPDVDAVSANYHVQATRKRNLLRERAEAAGCTHYLSVDCDEFYDPARVLAAREVVARHAYDATACCIQDYYFRPTWRAEGLADYCVPFVCRVDRPVRLVPSETYFCLADPSRRVYGDRCHVFAPGQVVMHHMTSVRAPGRLRFKYECSPVEPASIPGRCLAPASASDAGCVEVPDRFNVGCLS